MFTVGMAEVYKQNLCQDHPLQIQDEETVPYKAGMYRAGYEEQVARTQPE